MKPIPQVVLIEKLPTRKKKQDPKTIIRWAAKHNLREIESERGTDGHIDASKSHLNVVLAGATTAAGVALAAQTLMDEGLDKPHRHDAVRGLEIIFGLPPESGRDEMQFFRDCMAWSIDFYEVPLISAVVHFDEINPHLHLIHVPLFGGRLIGSGLAGSRDRYNKAQADFNAKVGQRYGLFRQTPVKRVSVALRREITNQIIAVLRFNPSRVNETLVKSVLSELLIVNPLPVAEALGLDIPTSKQSKRENTIAIGDSRKAIAFDTNTNSVPASGAQKGQTLSCVVFGIPDHSLTPEIPSFQKNQSQLASNLSIEAESEFVRIPINDYEPDDLSFDVESVNPDGKIPVEYWDSNLGEFITKPVRHGKAVQV